MITVATVAAVPKDLGNFTHTGNNVQTNAAASTTTSIHPLRFTSKAAHANISQKNRLPLATAYTHDANRCWSRTKLIRSTGGVSTNPAAPSTRRNATTGRRFTATSATATPNPTGNLPSARPCSQ